MVLWKQGEETRAVNAEFWLMVTEFFNRSVGTVYRIGRPTYYEAFLPTVPVTVGEDGSLTDGSVPIAPDYVLVTCRTPVVGEIVGTRHSGLSISSGLSRLYACARGTRAHVAPAERSRTARERSSDCFETASLRWRGPSPRRL